MSYLASNTISSNLKSMLLKFSHGLILNIFLRIKGLVYFPLLIIFLAKEDIGLIAYVQSICSLLAGFALLSIPDSSNRIILDLDKNYTKDDLSNGINSITNLSFLLALGSCFILLFTTIYFQLLDSKLVFIVSILFFSKALSKISQYIFQIYQKTKLLTIVTLVTEYSSLIIVICFLNFELYDDILFLLYIYSFCVLSSSIFLFFKLYNTIKFKLVIDYNIIKKVIPLSIYLLPASFSMLIIQSSDFILIEKYLGLDSLGEYSFAYAIGSVVTGLSMAITFFWYSTIVYTDDKMVSPLLAKVFKYIPLLFIVIVIGYHFLTQPLINLVTSNDYSQVFRIVQFLVIGFFLQAITQIFQGIMYARKKERVILFDSMLVAILNLLLNLFFMEKYGLIFAAYSTFGSYLLLYLLRLIYIIRLNYSSKSFIISNMFLILIIILNLTLLWI